MKFIIFTFEYGDILFINAFVRSEEMMLQLFCYLIFFFMASNKYIILMLCEAYFKLSIGYLACSPSPQFLPQKENKVGYLKIVDLFFFCFFVSYSYWNSVNLNLHYMVHFWASTSNMIFCHSQISNPISLIKSTGGIQTIPS